MEGLRFTVDVHLHGTLGANAQGVFSLPCGATLVELSACASNDSDATLKVGTSADDDGVFAAATIGDSSTPKIWDKGDFSGALGVAGSGLPHFAKGTIIAWVLDYDGAGGTASANVDLLFTFVEG